MQTKSAARNIFFGGTIFFFVVFAALVAQSHMYILNTSTPPLNDAVVRGKHVWERHACINCHTILGEGAYYAPELGNACKRLGGKEAVKGIIEAYQSAEEPVRQMPNFGIAGQDLDDLAEFLCWTSKIKTQNWPPNDAG